MSTFVMDAATQSAEVVIAAATATAVPPGFFDTLWRALEALPKANRALVKRAGQRRRVVQR